MSETQYRLDELMARAASMYEVVAPGYKQTEVGVIPTDWMIYSLFQLAGENKSRFDDGDWVEAEFLSDFGVRLLQTGNIGVGKFVDKVTRKYISPTSFELLRCKEVKPGDLLICRLADPAGRACIVPTLEEQKMITAVDVTIFRPIRALADPKFLLAVFGSRRWFTEVADRCGGSTRSRIARGQLAEIRVQVPEIREQRTIAEALSDVDSLLESLDTLIAKKRAIKQAATEQLLTGKIRLPGFSGRWEERRLGDLAIFLKGSGLSKSDLSLNGMRRCIHYGELFTTYGERITDVLHGTNREGNYPVCISNDVLMPTSDVTPNGLATASCILLPNTLIGGDILVIRTSTNVLNGVFLAYAIKVHRNQVMQLVSGTTVFHLYSRDMATFEFFSPSVEEQGAIVAVLSEMDDEIAALEQRRDKTQAIKQGMMQQLLTGRVRLV